MQDYERHTCNGSVDIRGDPASKKHTGKWRACYSILGNIHGGLFYSTLIPVMIVVSFLHLPILVLLLCRWRILRCFSVLCSWDKPCELPDQGAEAKQCCCSEQYRFVAGHLLPHSYSWSILGRFILGQTSNYCDFPDDLYHCKCAPLSVFSPLSAAHFQTQICLSV